MATRLSPRASSACAAATAMLLNTQKPMPAGHPMQRGAHVSTEPAASARTCVFGHHHVRLMPSQKQLHLPLMKPTSSRCAWTRVCLRAARRVARLPTSHEQAASIECSTPPAGPSGRTSHTAAGCSQTLVCAGVVARWPHECVAVLNAAIKCGIHNSYGAAGRQRCYLVAACACMVSTARVEGCCLM